MYHGRERVCVRRVVLLSHSVVGRATAVDCQWDKAFRDHKEPGGPECSSGPPASDVSCTSGFTALAEPPLYALILLPLLTFKVTEYPLTKGNPPMESHGARIS
jgi:hypothetical protein